jgi:hypothetical protein
MAETVSTNWSSKVVEEQMAAEQVGADVLAEFDMVAME